MVVMAVRQAWAAEQERLSALCVDHDDLDWDIHGPSVGGLEHVAGVDVSFFPDRVHAVAAVVVLSYPDLELLYERCATFKLTVPYMPGFLAFREVPALKAMLERVPRRWRPQAVLVDGNGVFHPRRCGAATHLGIVTGLPTIGVAKDILHVGDVNASLKRKVAKKLEGPCDWAPLAGDDAIVGDHLAVLLRPSCGKRTLVVSAGHRISLNTAVALTASLCRASIPEPIRQADIQSRAAVRAWFEGTPLRKLKLHTASGADDLLRMTAPESASRRGSSTGDDASDERLPKRGRHQLGHDGSEARRVCRSKRNRRSAVAPKPSMVWRVKAVQGGTPPHAADGPDGHALAVQDSTATVPDVPDAKTATEIGGTAATDEEKLFAMWSASPAEEDRAGKRDWSFWEFLKRSLCGLCVVRC
mmetsp:Transcript_6718/g.16669  ORF Transcript_6718/g.16669 Transcript_6718/m.16669 type:complete len:415 (+) Transcript_6718:50-1294(+)